MSCNRSWLWWLVATGVGILLVFVPALYADLRPFDEAIARYCNGLIGHNRQCDAVIVALNTKAGDITVFLFFLICVAIHCLSATGREERCRRMAFWAWALFMFPFCYLVQELLEQIFSRPSPGKLLNDWVNLRKMTNRNVKVASSDSFPSGHATFYWFFAFVMLRRYKVAGMLWLGLALLVPSTRLVTGAHWPSDIVLGSLPLCGLMAALLFETRLASLEQFFRFWCDNIHVRCGGKIASEFDATPGAPDRHN